MRIAKTLAAAAALTFAGGSIAAQAETVRTAAPVSEESELSGSTGTTHLLIIVAVAAAIVGGVALTDGDDDPVSQ
ncbi:hypothetical protein I5L01_00085 [Erythrobacter sp. YJ-T3-07]|uniref:hypothetical protein n=1 Tax=Erythrobacter sp. YJ-T3-07 TaxID=2793063 RepID=UPI0018D29610|nr:hypothetical protein [Erythrobacter sp. YJ-T3-07]MBH1942615.1 hypothetical protein [Erythrobacter sp. YJ-T3-07]